MGFCFHQDSYVTGEELWWELWRTPGKKARTKSMIHSLGKVSQEVRKFILMWEKFRGLCWTSDLTVRSKRAGFLMPFSGIVPTHPCPAHLRNQWSCKHLASEPGCKSHSPGWENLLFTWGRRHRHLQEKQMEGVPRGRGKRCGWWGWAPEPW